MQISDYAKVLPGWAQSEDSLKILISTKIKIVRNLVGFSYPSRLSNDSKLEVRQLILDAVKKVKSIRSPIIFDLENLSESEKLLLCERQLSSRKFISGNVIGRSILISEDETFSLCINGKDHLRIQTCLAGNKPDMAYFEAAIILEELGKYLDFAFDKQLGYLTADLVDTGTGLHVSQFFHTPVLELENQLSRVKRAVEQVDFTYNFNSLFNTKTANGFYTLSSRKTLGINETLLKNQISILSEKIIEYESKMRGISFVERKSFLEDKSWRAFGIFKTARIITGKETLRLLSDLRFATALKIIKNIDPKLLIKMLFQIQPGHLSILTDQKIVGDDIEKIRAEFIRDKLQDS